MWEDAKAYKMACRQFIPPMNDAHGHTDLQRVKNTQLFQNVASSRLPALLKHFDAQILESEEILLSPFKRNQHLYLLLEGELKVYLGSLDNQPITTIASGECVGEVSFIDNEPPSAYVLASQSSRVLRLHRDALTALLQQSPELLHNLLRLLCNRVRQGNRTLLHSEQNANIDALTGCFNRRWLEHVFTRESTRCAFNNQPLCLLMLDVDHFKAYNDQHGHLAGDYALCLVAHTLRNQLRPKDSLARYGGEEFVILLPEIGNDEARAIGERLRQTIERASSFYSPVGVLPGVTLSIGLTQMRNRDSLQAVIARADVALYRAKNQGRNCLRE